MCSLTGNLHLSQSGIAIGFLRGRHACCGSSPILLPTTNFFRFLRTVCPSCSSLAFWMRPPPAHAICRKEAGRVQGRSTISIPGIDVSTFLDEKTDRTGVPHGCGLGQGCDAMDTQAAADTCWPMVDRVLWRKSILFGISAGATAASKSQCVEEKMKK